MAASRHGLIILAAGVGMLSALAPSARAQADFRGIWTPERHLSRVLTEAGRAPPLKAEAKKLYDKRIADRKAGRSDDPVRLCQPPGIPRLMYQPQPFKVVQTSTEMAFLFQFQHMLRHIHIGEKLQVEDSDPLWDGYSVGRWQGQDLVVETAEFNGKTWLDQAGLPASPDLRVTERFRLLGANRLEDRITVTDAQTYARPWTTRLTFKRLPGGVVDDTDSCDAKLYPEPANVWPAPPARP